MRNKLTSKKLKLIELQAEFSSMRERGTVDDFDISLKKTYWKKEEEYLNHILNLIPPDAKTICDLGCGTGTTGKYLQDKLSDPSIQFTFVDCQERNLTKISPEEGLTACANLLLYEPEDKFDCVVSRLIHHYFPKTLHQDVFDKAFDLLTENGCYIDACPLEIDSETQDVINDFWRMGDTWTFKKKGYSVDILDDVYIHVPTINEFFQFAENAGFRTFSVHRFTDYNITHSISDLKPRYIEKEHEIKAMEEFLLSQSKNVRKNLGICETQKGVEISQPIYLLKALK